MTATSKCPPSLQDDNCQQIKEALLSKYSSFLKHKVLITKPQARLSFVNMCYHVPFLSQTELTGVKGDKGVLVYLIPLRWCLGGRTGGIRASAPWQLPIKQLSEGQSISSRTSSTWLTSEQNMSQFIWGEEKKISIRNCEVNVKTHPSLKQLYLCIFYFMHACHHKSTTTNVLVESFLAGVLAGEKCTGGAPRLWD